METALAHSDVADHKSVDNSAHKSVDKSVDDSASAKATQLPQPVGYKLLVALPDPAKTTAAGIIKADETVRREEVGSVTGFVLSMGADAYSDKGRFPNGPWCKAGDWIVMRAYSGTRLSIHGKEFRIINDDSVEAVVDDPRGIERL